MTAGPVLLQNQPTQVQGNSNSQSSSPYTRQQVQDAQQKATVAIVKVLRDIVTAELNQSPVSPKKYKFKWKKVDKGPLGKGKRVVPKDKTQEKIRQQFIDKWESKGFVVIEQSDYKKMTVELKVFNKESFLANNRGVNIVGQLRLLTREQKLIFDYLKRNTNLAWDGRVETYFTVARALCKSEKVDKYSDSLVFQKTCYKFMEVLGRKGFFDTPDSWWDNQ